MIGLSAGRKLTLPSPDILQISASPLKKIIYAVLFLLLAAGFFIGFDFFKGLSGSRLPGTIIYLAVTIIFLIASVFSRNYSLNRNNKTVLKQISLLSLNLAVKNLLQFTKDNVAVNLIGIPLFDNYPMDKIIAQREGKTSAKKGIHSSLFKKRFALYRIFIDNPEKRIMLLETTDYREAHKTAETIGRFLGIKAIESGC
ncbi:MAG: hypothetical protein GXP33_10160 [Spirochaetes bacterium]|nr:hypothetical protein [Spirochaetota bacterium]